MGLYERYLGPRIVNFVCGLHSIAEERRKVVPQAEGTVLEVGFGSGLNLPHYDAARVTEVIGVDPGREILALGEARRRASPVPVRILEAPAEAIPLPDAVADTAVLTFTLCTVDDPARVLAEIKRVLKPGGRMLFLEHGRAPDEKVARWQDRINPLWRKIGCGCNLNRDTLALLGAAGLSCVSLERFYLESEPKLVGFHCRGIAVPA